MFNRAGAAVCAAAIAAMLMVPAQLSARGAVGHPGGFRPMVRPMPRVHHPIVRPVHRVHPPFLHRHRAPFAHREFRERHDFHAARRHHRAILALPFFGYGLPLTYADDPHLHLAVEVGADGCQFARWTEIAMQRLPPVPPGTADYLGGVYRKV